MFLVILNFFLSKASCSRINLPPIACLLTKLPPSSILQIKLKLSPLHRREVNIFQVMTGCWLIFLAKGTNIAIVATATLAMTVSFVFELSFYLPSFWSGQEKLKFYLPSLWSSPVEIEFLSYLQPCIKHRFINPPPKNGRVKKKFFLSHLHHRIMMMHHTMNYKIARLTTERLQSNPALYVAPSFGRRSAKQVSWPPTNHNTLLQTIINPGHLTSR